MNNAPDNNPSLDPNLDPNLDSNLEQDLGPLQEGTVSDPTASESNWLRLEQQVGELIELTNTLSRENKALRTQQRNWTSERAKLIEKNELAKSRVESMITRLKALEND